MPVLRPAGHTGQAAWTTGRGRGAGANPASNVVRKLERELVARYTEGCVAELLRAETKASDLLALEDGKFLLLLPETEPANARIMVARVVQSCFTTLGLKLHADVVAFPSDELTLQGMLERGAGHGPGTRPGDRSDPEPALQAVPQPA